MRCSHFLSLLFKFEIFSTALFCLSDGRSWVFKVPNTTVCRHMLLKPIHEFRDQLIIDSSHQGEPCYI